MWKAAFQTDSTSVTGRNTLGAHNGECHVDKLLEALYQAGLDTPAAPQHLATGGKEKSICLSIIFKTAGGNRYLG